MSSGLDLLTIVYGESHLELFRRTALKSLAQQENKRAIYAKNSRWNICTDDKHFDYVKRTVDIHFPELEVNLISRSDLRGFTDPIQTAVIWQIKEALGKKKVLLAPPDTIFSEGAVPAMLKASEGGKCVAVPHARALPSLLGGEYLCSSHELFRLTWRHLHKSWRDAELGCDGHNFRAGGVQWEWVNETVRGVHMLPSPYLLQFTEEDLSFFQRQISFGGFDHIWPSKMLIPQGRRAYLNDNKSCFIVEITEQFKNVPPIFPGSHEVFWREDTRNELTREELLPNRTPFYFMGEVK